MHPIPLHGLINWLIIISMTVAGPARIRQIESVRLVIRPAAADSSIALITSPPGNTQNPATCMSSYPNKLVYTSNGI